MNTLKASEAVLALLANIPGGIGQEAMAKRKAEIICDFAQKVNDGFFRRLGYNPDAETGSDEYKTVIGNALAHDMKVEVPDGESYLDDSFRSLILASPSSDLRSREEWDIHVEVVFCTTRVMLREGCSSRYRRPMSYEEAARYIVYFLAEQILVMMRKNNWYDSLEELFDKVEGVFRSENECYDDVILVRSIPTDRTTYVDMGDEMGLVLAPVSDVELVSSPDCEIGGQGYHKDHLEEIARAYGCSKCGKGLRYTRD